MNLEHESRRWVELGLVDAEQRARILALYPPAESSVSLLVLAILWCGGALVFLGLAFLLGQVWDDLGPLRALAVAALDGAFFAGGAVLLRRSGLERTAMALLCIAGLLLPLTLGVTWDELFGSSDHPLPLVVICTLAYAGLAAWLGSRVFAALFVVGLFFAGEEVIRDEAFGALFPLVQLGIVDELHDVYPLVFLSQAVLVLVLSRLAALQPRLAPLAGTLQTWGVLLGLGPATVGTLEWPRDGWGVRVLAGFAAALGALAWGVHQRARGPFWCGAAAIPAMLFLVLVDAFEGSIAVMCSAIVLGGLVLAVGSWLALRRPVWLEQLFQDPDEPPPAPAPAPGSGSPEPSAPPPLRPEA